MENGKSFFISASRVDEPNETSLTIAGFPAHDIYKLLVGDIKETNNEQHDN